MENNQNNNEVSDNIFKSADSSKNSGFEKVNNSDKKSKSTNSFYSGKPKYNIAKNIVLPFITGALGATLALGICVKVPSINEKIFTSGNSKSGNTPSIIKTSGGGVSSSVNLSDYSNTAVSVANKVLPSVVSIEIEYTVTSPSFYGYSFGNDRNSNTSTATASGSGVIITSDGYILTNNHVVNEDSASSYYQVSTANKISVHLYNSDKSYDATIVGTDDITDLAILKIDAKDLTAAELGDSSKVSVGEFAMAIGSPLEMDNSVTAGIISALNREITDSENTNYNLIQTDAAINAGNSGGALVNADGKVIGINTLKLSGEAVEGLGFAIPINDTLDIIDQLITYNKVKRPYLGIQGRDISEEHSKYYNIPKGVYVHSVEEKGPADIAGLKVGDIITKLDDKSITNMTELTKEKNNHKIGDTVTITVSRNGKDKKLKLKLAEDPN